VTSGVCWEQRQALLDEPGLLEFAAALDLPPLVASVLARRGIADPAAAAGFLQPRLADLPDPMTMLGLPEAVERLCRALRDGERIAIHGDYDVDGITGTALLVEGLSLCGGSVDYHIPLRLTDGYGLSAEALRTCAASGTGLVVSVDCGISAHAEADLAAELGLDLIITDHHQPPEHLPAALARLNPHLPGCRFPFKELAGVGVAFFLLAGVRRRLRESGWFASRSEPDLRRQLDLVALGTIADMVPLQGVNRTLVGAGLQLLDRGERLGVRALREVAGVKTIDCGAVGFRLAPRLNAAGRLEDAKLGVELLLETDEASALATARRLDDCNNQRQELERRTFDQAVVQLEAAGGAAERHALVLADPQWHAGVIGIVASRLVERYHRPTCLIALDGDRGKGSARSIRGFHLYRGLLECAEHLDGFGGHEFAAGLSIDTARIAAFAAALEKSAAGQLTPADLLPTRSFDDEADLEEFDAALVARLATLAPFGIGNPEPVFLLHAVQARSLREVGKGHLQLTCVQGGYSLPAIAFGMAERSTELAGPVDLLVSVGVNEWRGRSSTQLRVRDLRPADAGTG